MSVSSRARRAAFSTSEMSATVNLRILRSQHVLAGNDTKLRFTSSRTWSSSWCGGSSEPSSRFDFGSGRATCFPLAHAVSLSSAGLLYV